jgi:hypothetical protein
MNATRSAPPRVYLFGIAAMALLLIGFAVYEKSDVKAALKMFGIELSIETKDHPPH